MFEEYLVQVDATGEGLPRDVQVLTLEEDLAERELLPEGQGADGLLLGLGLEELYEVHQSPRGGHAGSGDKGTAVARPLTRGAAN